MSTKTLIEYTDDLDGSKGAEPFRFGLDGTEYVIDLKGGNAKKFRKAVGPYAARARRVRQKPASRPQAAREHGRKVRSWARKNGYKIGDMGRIPFNVEEAFRAALRNERTLI